MAECLSSMAGSIARCLADLERRLALPPVRWETDAEDWQHTETVSRLTLSGKPDYYALLSVAIEGREEYDATPDFSLEGDTVVLPRLAAGARVVLTYAPRAVRVARWEDSEELAGVPEALAALIPYYVKGDLFREESPAEAGEARNWYEAGVEEVLARRLHREAYLSPAHASAAKGGTHYALGDV